MEDTLKKIQKLLDAAEADIHTARSLMRDALELKEKGSIDTKSKAKELSVLEEGKVIEGVFNGQNMIGADGKEYPIPANYASKSKLVEGDALKLTIAEDGGFMYKQIAPIERRKIIGSLKQSDGIYMVSAEGKDYKVLQASITYYKGEPGDQVTIILPKEHDSAWAAVENVIKRTTVTNEVSETTLLPTVDVKPEKKPKPLKEIGKDPEIEFPSNNNSDIETYTASTETQNTGDSQSVDKGIKELEI